MEDAAGSRFDLWAAHGTPGRVRDVCTTHGDDLGRHRPRRACGVSAARIRAAVETVIEGKPDVVRAGPDRAARRGPPAHRGRARRRQDDARQGAGPLASTARCAASSSPPTCCPATSPACRVFNQETPRVRVQARARSSPTSSSATRSTAPRPKTQSALLECMEERQVTVDGTTYQLAAPFMVIATQNPIEMEGTYPLPEAQRDRFMARVSMGYPAPGRRARDARHATAGASPLDDLEPVTDAADRAPADRDRPRTSTSSTAVKQYAVDLVTATRDAPRPAARRLAARHPAPGARGQGRRRAGRPRLRAARRRPGRWPCRCWPTGSCSPPRPRWPGAVRRPIVLPTWSAGPGRRVAGRRARGR